MADFPTAKTEAVDNVTDVLAKHVNNLEDKVGIDSSADASSLDYKVAQNTEKVSFDSTSSTKLGTIEEGADVTDAANIASSIVGVTGKTTPIDADTIPMIDSASSNSLKELTWANLKATIKTYYDSVTATLTNKTLTSPLFGGTVDGWIASGETWTYASVDDPTGVITVPTDATDKYSVGMKLSLVNGGNTIYGIITVVTSTTITFLHEINPADSEALHLMANSAITVPRYSTQKAPLGFPLDPDKWEITVTDSSYKSGTATQNLWSNISQLNIVIPIGIWQVRQKLTFYVSRTTNGIVDCYYTLSTGNNTETNTVSTARTYARATTDGSRTESGDTIINSFLLSATSKTTYYTNIKTAQSGVASIAMDGASVPSLITAVCAYL